MTFCIIGCGLYPVKAFFRETRHDNIQWRIFERLIYCKTCFVEKRSKHGLPATLKSVAYRKSEMFARRGFHRFDTVLRRPAPAPTRYAIDVSVTREPNYSLGTHKIVGTSERNTSNNKIILEIALLKYSKIMESLWYCWNNV